MAAIVYDGLDGMEAFSETAKQALKGGAIGAATGLGVVFLTNKIGFLSKMNPIVKGVVQLGVVIGVATLAKDKVGEEVAAGMGVGGSAVILGTLVGQLLSHRNTATPQNAAAKHGWGEAVAPVIEEYDGYGEAVAPVIEEELDGYGEVYDDEPEVYVDGYGVAEEDEEGIYVDVE